MLLPVRCVAILVMAASLTACSNELVVLLPEAGGATGRLDVRAGSDTVTLDTAYAGARSGLLGPESVSVPESQVRSDFARALAAVPPEPVSYILYFEEGTTSVVADSREAFERLLADVRARTVSEVQVTGHTDRVGSVEDNDRLARERATMVRVVLVRQGLAPDSVRAVGRGERAPLVPTADEVREARNRRVEVIVR